jgi:hypothetical protein
LTEYTSLWRVLFKKRHSGPVLYVAKFWNASHGSN